MNSWPVPRIAQEQGTQSDIHQQLILYDPVLWGILKVTRQKTWWIVFLSLAVYGGAYFGLGWLVSTHSGVHAFISIFTPRELLTTIINFFIVAPIIWVYYTQESMKITRMFQKLSSRGIFGTIRPDGQSAHEFFQKQIQVFNTKKRFLLILMLITAITILFLVSWLVGFYDPHNPWRIGKLPWWYELNRAYFIGIYLPLTFLIYYMSLWFFVRRYIAVTILNRALNNFTLMPKLLDSDKANGLSPVGHYVTKAGPLMAVYGFWLFEVFFYPTFFGQSITLNLNSLETLVVYLLLAPLILYLPVRKLHQAMSKNRNEHLDTVAEQIRCLLAATERDIVLPNRQFPLFEGSLHQLFPKDAQTITPQEVQELTSTIDALSREYQLFEKEYRKWPFRKFEVGNYIFAIALPLVLSLLQIIFQIVSIYK